MRSYPTLIFLLSVLNSVICHPTESGLVQLSKRGLKCSAEDGPTQETTFLAEFYQGSMKDLESMMNQTFNSVDSDQDGSMDSQEMHQFVRTRLPTTDPSVNISAPSIDYMADGNGIDFYFKL
jgi:hypothetical protein